jgi:hypothetical protein
VYVAAFARLSLCVRRFGVAFTVHSSQMSKEIS